MVPTGYTFSVSVWLIKKNKENDMDIFKKVCNTIAFLWLIAMAIISFCVLVCVIVGSVPFTAVLFSIAVWFGCLVVFRLLQFGIVVIWAEDEEDDE